MKTLAIIALTVCSLSVFAKSDNLVRIDNIVTELCTKVSPVLFGTYNDLDDVSANITDIEELKYANEAYNVMYEFQKKICNIDI
ncbi:MAG: hypothetical protein KAQ98_10395 [Bacteriovoracaceae bacterium]|nr:hypothetical protein [Bacteriovoracaceae bacterium]